jgi:cysteine desulfurase
MALDNAGILCAAGSACSASNEEASHVLMAMSVSEEAARSSLRFSMGRQTTQDEITQTVKTLASLIH